MYILCCNVYYCYMKRNILLVVLMTGFIVSFCISQASADEMITNHASNMSVSSDNVGSISERITYDFGFNNKHGVIRVIPFSNPIKGSSGYYNYNFSLGNVTQDGQTAEYKDEIKGYFRSVKIGNPDTTISGEHVYEINYDMSPIVRRDKAGAGDVFYWNVVGDQWQVPINNATATVIFPANIKVKDARCYTGEYGSKESNCKIDVADNQITVSATNLISLQGVTVQALLPSNSFNKYLEASSKRPINLEGILQQIVKYAIYVMSVPLILLGIYYGFKDRNQDGGSYSDGGFSGGGGGGGGGSSW